MRILGGDICKDRVVCWLLEDCPIHLKDYWKANISQRSRNPYRDDLTFFFNQKGISNLLKLKPDAIVLEPTGVHYSWLLAHICTLEGIEVLWVGHCEAVYYRKQNKLPDKNDLADALALAAYGHIHYGKQGFFLHFEPGKVAQIKDLWFQLKSLTRIQSPIINRLRQQLAREFPEASLIDSQQSSDGLAPLWGWLSGRRLSPYYDRLYAKSVAPKYVVEISDFTRKISHLLCDVHLWEREIESELTYLLGQSQFKLYDSIFTRFGMGVRTRALLLSQIYPISKFESLGSFKKRLGMAGDEVSSGDRIGWNKGSGSKLCRTELYLWVLCSIAPHNSRPPTKIGQLLGDFYDRRREYFQDNPDVWKERALVQERIKVINRFKAYLNDSIEQSMLFEVRDAFKDHLDASDEIFDSFFDGSDRVLDQNQVKRSFGKLLICQTAAYGVRLLFRELKRILNLHV